MQCTSVFRESIFGFWYLRIILGLIITITITIIITITSIAINSLPLENFIVKLIIIIIACLDSWKEMKFRRDWEA